MQRHHNLPVTKVTKFTILEQLQKRNFVSIWSFWHRLFKNSGPEIGYEGDEWRTTRVVFGDKAKGA